MKVFKNNLFAGLLAVLAFVLWSLPVDVNAATDKATEKAADKAAATPGQIFDKGDNVAEKRRKVEEYLRGRYKGPGKVKGVDLPVIIRTKFRRDGSIGNMKLRADFTPPGFVAKEGATEDEDLRARALAFLDAEKRLLGLDDLQGELKERDINGNKYKGGPESKSLLYDIAIEGIMLRGANLIFTLRNGKPFELRIFLPSITPELLAAAKKFKAEGFDKEAAHKSVKADLAKRGVPREIIDNVRFFIPEDNVYLTVNKSDHYVVWMYVVVAPNGVS